MGSILGTVARAARVAVAIGWLAGTAAADVAPRGVVVSLRGVTRASGRSAPLAALAPRFASLGLTPRRWLLDGLEPRDGEWASVLVLEARDSIAAANAIAALNAEPSVAWAEPEILREPAVVSIARPPSPEPLP